LGGWKVCVIERKDEGRFCQVVIVSSFLCFDVLFNRPVWDDGLVLRELFIVAKFLDVNSVPPKSTAFGDAIFLLTPCCLKSLEDFLFILKFERRLGRYGISYRPGRVKLIIGSRCVHLSKV